VVLDIKGYPGRHQPTVTVDTKKQHSVIRGFLEGRDDKLVFTPQRTWIERGDGSIAVVLDNPRASFADHVRSTQWTELQLAYFVGCAMNNYMTTPFCFTWPGFKTRELDEHREREEL